MVDKTGSEKQTPTNPSSSRDEDPEDRIFRALSESGEGTPTGIVVPLTQEEARARDKRNIFIALGVTAFVVVVFLTTVLRLVQNIEAGR